MEPVLKASVHDVKYFAALLRGINFVNRAVITADESGLTVIAEETQTLHATAFIFSDMFDEYSYNSETLPSSQENENEEVEPPENAAFEIPLNTLIECLNIFGTAGGGSITTGGAKFRKFNSGDESDDEASGDEDKNKKRRGKMSANVWGSLEKTTGMRLSYQGEGFPLTLLLAEDANGPTTTCEITTYDAECRLDLPFDNDNVVLKIILKSSWLREALSELDTSCSKFTFIGYPPDALSPKPGKNKNVLGVPLLRIQGEGAFGTTEMDYPNDRDVLETFECSHTVSFSYRFAHILKTLRALQSSTKTSLRIDSEGQLSLQFLMPTPPHRRSRNGEHRGAFIQFNCLALDDDL